MSSVMHIPPTSVTGEDDTARTGEADGSGRAADGPRLVELVQRSARGQQDAFAELYATTSAQIRSTVIRVLRSPDQAAEVTQEVYVAVWRQAARYSPDKGGVLAWMTTMARRRAVDRVRSITRAAAREQWYSRERLEPAHDHVWSGVEQRMDADRVRRALATLTAIQREAIVLAYYGGYSQTQIAAMLDIPLGTVKTRIRNAMIRLRQAWEVSAGGAGAPACRRRYPAP